MSRRFIGFRLRKELDEDIYDATKDLDGNTISELGRTGLRLALGITSHKVMEVKVIPVTAQPKIWRPKQK